MSFIFTPSNLAAVIREPIVRIYVNSIRRSDARVTLIQNACGFAPSAMTLEFPMSKYDHDPVAFGDEIEVFVNPHIFRAPMFRGLVVNPTDTQSRDVNEVSFVCFDERWRLNDSYCSRNFNEQDEKTKEYREELYTREIIHEILTEYRSHQAANNNANYLRPILSSFPNVFPGNLNLKGVPHGDAIQQILQDYGGDNWRVYVVHYETHSYLKAFAIGSGLVGSVVRGTDVDKSAKLQPFGIANIGSIDRTEEHEQIVNHLVAFGARKQYETSLQLVKFWNTSIQANVLAKWDQYTKKQISGKVNADHDPRAAFVATRYAFPEIVDGSVTRRPKVLPDIVQDFVFTDAEGTTHKAKPFLAYKFSGDETWSVKFDGFSVQDDELIVLSQPLVKQTQGADETSTKEVPSEIWLDFAYLSEGRISYDTNKQGDADRDKKQMVIREEFEYKAKYAYFALSWNGSAIVATYTAGTDVVKNDSSILQAWALRRVVAHKKVPETFSMTFPRCDLGYKLGQRLRVNNRLTNTNITQINYDLINFNTELTAMAE